MALARWKLVGAAAAGAVGELLHRRWSARSRSRSAVATPPTEAVTDPPALITQSSPGQIADLQQAYGAEMAPASVPPPREGPASG